MRLIAGELARGGRLRLHPCRRLSGSLGYHRRGLQGFRISAGENPPLAWLGRDLIPQILPGAAQLPETGSRWRDRERQPGVKER